MNNIEFHTYGEGPTFTGGDLKLTCSPEMEKWFAKNFDLEIEILQAERHPAPDGQTRLVLKVMNEEKAVRIRQFCILIIVDQGQHKPN